MLSDTSGLPSPNSTLTPKLGVYSKDTFTISTPYTREQDKVAAFNKLLRGIK